MRYLNNHRRLLLFIVDTIIMICSCVFVFFIIPNNIFDAAYLPNFIVIIGSVSITRLLFRIYGSIWRYAATDEYILLMAADFCGCILGYAADRLIFSSENIPVIHIISTYMLSLIIVLFSRFVYRQLRYMKDKYKATDIKPVNVAVIGAGYAGMTLVSEMKNSKKYIPYCFFDNDSVKIGKFIHGVPVKGSVEEIPGILRGSPVTQIVVAIPSISGEALENILNICSKTSCKIKIYEYPMDRMDCKFININPPICEPLESHSVGSHPVGSHPPESNSSGSYPVESYPVELNSPEVESYPIKKPINLNMQLRNINIEDLLSRKQINLDISHVKSFISGKKILVTGGGGSIGSELCRQIAKMAPAHLIIVDIYENNAYDIQQELKGHFNDLYLSVEIASVRDEEKVDTIFRKYKPEIVFHAAAHKHVPLMEDCPDEAIKNNVFGTYNVAMAAERYGALKMVMISTDKAVNPTNIMGATKRVCEMIIQSMRNSRTEYVAVRFGNVLGSNGSVIPLFKKQIEKGGPITITDKRIIRYFMTIPEAVQLVMQAGVMAAKSEIFVLDMGAPVKIYDLALNMIKLSGLTPDVDIEIKEIGLRPGEKLFEELLVNVDEMTKTDNEKIFIEHTCEENILTREKLDLKLDILKNSLKTKDKDKIKAALMKIVPTFKSPEDVNVKYFELEMVKAAEITGFKDVNAMT